MKDRIFFSLWPDAITRDKIAKVQSNIFTEKQGRIIPIEDLHLTLCFVGDVAHSTRDEMANAAAEIKCARFEMQLDRCRYWPNAHIVHIDAENTPSELQKLVDDLSAALKPYGYQSDFPDFKAHVTLARNIKTEPQTWPDFEAISWAVNEFVLVSSHPEDARSVYHIEENFLLL